MSIEYLVEKYSKLVYKICFDILKSSPNSEDVVQEVFLTLYVNLTKYIELPESEIKNIICKIALNKCKDILKSKSQKLSNMTDYNIVSFENYEEDNGIEEEIFKKQRSHLISKMIDELNRPYSVILYKYYILEKTLDEIATEENITKATLKMQLHRGRKILKEKLNENGGEQLL